MGLSQISCRNGSGDGDADADGDGDADADGDAEGDGDVDSDVDADFEDDGSTDAEPDSDVPFVPTAEIVITGAQSETWSYNGAENDLNCFFLGEELIIDFKRSDTGTEDELMVTIRCYTGPSTYDLDYDLGSECHDSLRVFVGSDYWYEASCDTSRIDSHEVCSPCVVEITEDLTAPEGVVLGTIECQDVFASIASADYEDDPLEFQPSIDLSVEFRCDPL